MKIARSLFSFVAVVLFSGSVFGQTFTAPEGYDLIYSLDLSKVVGSSLDNYGHVPYTTNNSSEFYGLVESIGYHYQLGNATTNNWVFVSADAFTGDTTKMGLPSRSSEGVFQRYLTNMNYEWNAPGFNLGGTTTGSGSSAKGNIEFWPTNYGAANAYGIPGASGDEYDYGDEWLAGGNHGSMQIHVHGTNPAATAATIFAFNGWGGGSGPYAVGIGTNSKVAATGGIGGNVRDDWTFATNSNDYATRQVDVYAKKFTFENVSNAEDRAFLLSETAGGKIAYKIQVPETGALNYNNHVLIDDTATMRLPVESVAYYVEATRKDLPDGDPGKVEYVYASMEGLTINPARVGMPLNGQFIHQKNVENLTVRSNVAGVTEVTNSPYGNVEIWRNSYNNGSGAGTNSKLPKSDGKYDFNDYRTGNVGDTAGFGSFQIHNHEKFVSDANGTTGSGAETVFAVNNWSLNGSGSASVDFGMGNNPAAVGSTNTASSAPHLDWTFDSATGGTKNRANYSDVTMYAIVKPAYAPGMKTVANASDYTMVQGLHITDSTNIYMNDNGASYFIDNTAQMKAAGVMFDRVGYYMEYMIPNTEELYYAYVSMDAFQLSGGSQVTGMAAGDLMQDITKIGVPDYARQTKFQQYVKNLEIATNIPESEGILTVDGKVEGQRTGTARKGYLEFWPSDYNGNQAPGFTHGSGSLFDTNDGGSSLAKGHGSMQIHNVDTNETIMGMSHFNNNRDGNKEFGIGTNPNATNGRPAGALDWTFHTGKQGYEVANIYMFVRESNAVMATMDAASGYSMYQRDVYGKATVDIKGAFITKAGTEIAKMQFSVDGGQSWQTMSNLSLDTTAGTFSADVMLSTGWHDVDIRALDAGGVVLTSTSLGDKVGVGEIFITAGQSNSANHGDATTQPKSGNVLAMDWTTGAWKIANDPQPGTTGTSGSTWPAFGDKLSAMLSADAGVDVPVGVVSVGVGGSRIDEWDPDNAGSYFNTRLKNAIEMLDDQGTDFAGILWHQGESNYGNASNYQATLEKLVAASRRAAEWDTSDLPVDWDVPWLISLVSALGDGSTDPNVIAAQLAVINGDPLAFLGPDSDWVKNYYDEGTGSYIYRGKGGNSIHFSLEGLEYMGELWALAAYDMIQGRQAMLTPEPATWAMMLLGFIGIAAAARRRRK